MYLRTSSGTLGLAALALLMCSSVGCAQRTITSAQTEVQEVAVQRDARVIPGVVEEVWEEPMVDVIDVPPGLDPEGHYYRPGHQEVVEIRQGRWNYYRGANGR